MPLDRALLGNTAQEQMEALERDYGNEEGVEIGAVMTFVEILKPEGHDEQGNVKYASFLRRRHNVGDPYRLAGLLDQSIHEILAGPGIT
jgi:hypothetical protein